MHSHVRNFLSGGKHIDLRLITSPCLRVVRDKKGWQFSGFALVDLKVRRKYKNCNTSKPALSETYRHYLKTSAASISSRELSSLSAYCFVWFFGPTTLLFLILKMVTVVSNRKAVLKRALSVVKAFNLWLLGLVRNWLDLFLINVVLTTGLHANWIYKGLPVKLFNP